MISERHFADVRIAAALNHAFPGLATRLSDGDRVVAEVLWPTEHPTGGAEIAVLHPCAFRKHVASAWNRIQSGQEMRCLDVEGDPVVEIRAVTEGQSWPSGMVLSFLPGKHVYAFGTTLDPDACAAMGNDIIEAFAHPDGVIGVGIQGDADTQTSIIFGEMVDDAGQDAHDGVVDVLEQLIARFATTQLLDGLPSAAGHRDGRH